MAEIRGVMGNASPILSQHPHGRLMAQPSRPLLTEPVLSPILTDTEISPLHRTGIGSAPGLFTKVCVQKFAYKSLCTKVFVQKFA